MLIVRKPGRLRRFAVAAVAAGVGVTGFALNMAPAKATYLDTSHTDRYSSQNGKIDNWTSFAPDGTPLARDPNCPTFPGVRRFSHVWTNSYGINEPLHTNFDMQFHTTYAPAVAVAKLVFQQARVSVPCSTLDAYTGLSTGAAMRVACSLPNSPARWCDLLINHPNDPSTDLHLDDRCDPPNRNWGVPVWHEWHDLPHALNTHGNNPGEALLYTVKIVFGLKMPVYLDDITIVGGVRNFDQATAQPSWGNSWIGYGRTPSPAIANLLVSWYDDAARRLGKDPIGSPVGAHNAVDNAIAAGKGPRGAVGGFFGTRKDLYNIICGWSPMVANVLDANNAVTNSAIGQDLSGWVQRETGKTLCKNIQNDPQFKALAPLICVPSTPGAFFAIADNGKCMNRPTDPVANGLGTDLGCNRDLHIARLFNQVKAFLGG